MTPMITARLIESCAVSKTGYLYPQRKHNNDDEFDFAPESYGFDESQEVPVEVKAGTVLFFNGYLLHRSRKNRSNIYRGVLRQSLHERLELIAVASAGGGDGSHCGSKNRLGSSFSRMLTTSWRTTC